jgi:hypothetical protein
MCSTIGNSSSSIDISDINGDILAINTEPSMSRWNFSDEDSSPEPINSPSQFIISANSSSSPAILPDSILAGDSDADEESTDVECTGIPDEIIDILSDIIQLDEPTTSSFGEIVEANSNSINFMESNEMELFFEYMMNDPTTSPLRYGEAVENAFTTWLSIFTSAYNNQLLKKFFKSIYDTFIIVYPLFNIKKTNINKKIADKLNTITTVEEEGEEVEVEDSDDGNNIDEEDDKGIVESSLNASTTQVACILAKKTSVNSKNIIANHAN